MWYMASASIASVVNYGAKFLLQKFWTFRDKDTRAIRRQAGKYAVLALSLFVANLALLHVLVEYGHLWYITAQVIVTVPLTIVSYLVSRRIFAN
jgi:putative flippase GtrA